MPAALTVATRIRHLLSHLPLLRSLDHPSPSFNGLSTRLTQAILLINSEDQVTEQLSIAFGIDGKALTIDQLCKTKEIRLLKKKVPQ
jgi:hypothetical protein